MSHRLTLIRLEGPDDVGPPPRVVLESDAAAGRAVENDLHLPAPSVSRRHAVFRKAAGGWFLTDAGSTSGTLVNARRLEPDRPAPLEPGDRVTIGPWVFRVGGDGSATRTVGLTVDAPGTASVPLSSRRLDALSACLDEMERAGGAEDLALAALRACMDGTGFGRAAVLIPPAAGSGEAPGLLAGLVRRGGSSAALEPAGFAPSSSLIERARAGTTAVLSGPAGGAPAYGQSIAEWSIHSAVCVPVMPEGRVAALLYLDARSGESPVGDAAGYCEDVARLYAFALTRDAQADLRRRQEALRIELDRAREIRAMLAPPAEARAGGYRHASRTIAGLFVSADLFDAIGHADGSATLLFGDASGHGVGAAMLAALVQSHLVSALASGAGLGEAVSRTNAFVATRPTGGRFVSLVAAHLGADGSVSLVDAGHGHWMVARRGSDPEHAPRAGGLPLGVDPGASFPASTLTLSPGDRLVCYTDGIPDQVDARREPFGHARLERAVRGSEGCEGDVARVFDALLRHAGERALDDDATVASVQFDPL